MYEAMRQRAPISSQAIGASVTALVVALTGYAALTGIGGGIGEVVLKPTTVVTLPPVVDDRPRDPVEPVVAADPVSLDRPKLFVPEPLNFPTDDRPRIAAEPTDRIAPRLDPVIGPVAPPAPVIHGPSIRPGDPPPYPPTAIRARLQGVTGLDACIDARGRVTSVQLARSSGHTRLDEEAMKWVRGVRFNPATRDGAPEAVCGHRIDYEWRLVDAQR